MRGLLLALALLASAAFAEENVVSFHSDIQIAANGEMTVTETIDVNVEGRQIRRGILRDFPSDYEDRFGRKVTVPFDVVSVTRDGAAEPYATSRKANGFSVRIGSPSVMLPHGRHVYRITYRTNFQVGFFEDHDELYWNVNGNGWTFAMDEISADVSLPSPVPAAQLKVEAYTGFFGARGRHYAAEARDGGAGFRTTRQLYPNEGLTIVVMFPKGIVAPPTLRDSFGRWLKDNRAEVYGVAGLLVVLAFLFLRWTVVGRDPRSGPLYPRYEAPQGLGPAGVRYLDRMGCDDRCFAAALLGLGQRGYLKIRESGGVFEIERTPKDMQWLPGEAAVAAVAPPKGTRQLGTGYDPAVQQARAGLELGLKQHFSEKFFSRNYGSLFAAVLLAAGTLGMMFTMQATPVAIGVLAVLLVAALVAAAKLLPAYTREGRRLQDEVEGLRQYLSVAERDDLARQKRPPRTKEEFAKFLPYAVALGVEKTWADTFAKVLGAAALAAATADYYSSSSDSGSAWSSSSSFTDSIGSLGSTISSSSTPPGSSSGGSDSGGGSSGGGGGGSSGGGGGGGGGSGW